jgi:hypothetical protein
MTAEQASMSHRGQPDALAGWRSALRRELSVLLLLKALALALLWWLFFSPGHRTVVDASATSRRLAVTAPLRAAPAAPVGTGVRP